MSISILCLPVDAMSSTDYYEILGIPRTSTQNDIKKAFRKLALQYHPDKNKSKDADEKFKLLNEARDTLSDPTCRKQYDLQHPVATKSASASSSRRHHTKTTHTYESTFNPSAFNAFPSSPKYGPNETPFTHRRKSKSGKRPPFYPTYGFENNDFTDYFTKFWDFPEPQHDRRFNFKPWNGYNNGFSFHFEPGSGGASQPRESTTRGTTKGEPKKTHIPVEKETNFRKTKDGWSYTSTSYSYVSGDQKEDVGGARTSSFRTSKEEPFKFSMNGKSSARGGTSKPTSTQYHRYFTPYDEEEHDTGKEDNFNYYTKTTNDKNAGSRSSSGKSFVPEGATVIDLTSDSEAGDEALPNTEPNGAVPNGAGPTPPEEILTGSPSPEKEPCATPGLGLNGNGMNGQNAERDNHEDGKNEQQKVSDDSAPQNDVPVDDTNNFFSHANFQSDPLKRHIPTPSNARGSPPKRPKTKPAPEGYYRLREDFTNVPPFTQTFGNFDMAELSKNIREEMQTSVPVEPSSPEVNERPQCPAASSDNEREFYTAPQSAEQPQQQQEPPLMDLHDSILVFDILPPDPPVVPALTSSMAEIYTYGQKLELYQKEWNEYCRKMCQYHDERAVADANYDIQYYLSVGAMERYLQAQRQDIMVKERWQLAQQRHCKVLESFLQFKMAQDGPRA